MKNKEVIEALLNYHPDLGKEYHGCDEIKTGYEDEECTGVAVALVPTMEVLEKAVNNHCSLLIVHEPIYYQTPDYPIWKGDFKNTVQLEKQEFIQKHHLCIYRDHDHMHANQPDSIFTGVLKHLGWENQQIEELKGTPFVYAVKLDTPLTVLEMCDHLAKCIGLNGIRYIGKNNDIIHKVMIVGHLYPNAFYPDGEDKNGYYQDYAMHLMKLMEEENIDAIIPGEIIEWTILSYIRDATFMNHHKSCFNIGHFMMEELGMKELTNTIDELIQHQVSVTYIPTKEAFSYQIYQSKI